MNSDAVLQTADLTPIPPHLLSELAQAIESINMTQMDKVLTNIDEAWPETANKLRRLVNQFEYDTILDMIDEVKG